MVNQIVCNETAEFFCLLPVMLFALNSMFLTFVLYLGYGSVIIISDVELAI